MSTFADYLKDTDFMPAPATRQVIERVWREASDPARKGELGAWMYTFARLAVMTPGELEARGCPVDQVTLLCDSRWTRRF